MDRWQYLEVQELRQELEQEQPEVQVEVELNKIRKCHVNVMVTSKTGE